MSLGQYLRSMRRQKGYTIKQVVDQADGMMDKTTISRIERDERNLSLRAAYCLSRIYNVNLTELCEYTLGAKLKPTHVPFETSPEERNLVRGYRRLSRTRKKSARDTVRGLAMAAPTRSTAQARKLLKLTMEKQEEQV